MIGSCPWVADDAASVAKHGNIVAASTNAGTAFDFSGRPSPNIARNPCANSTRHAPRTPSRAPS